MNAAIVLSEGLVASQLWSQEQYQNLLLHLHGDNPPKHFGFSLVPKDDHQAIFRHNKRLSVQAAILSTWKSLSGEAERPYALVLLPSSSRKSTWVAWDFDFHDQPSDSLSADMRRNLNVFIREAELLKSSGLSYLVEHSGNGWHFWLIGDRPRAEKEWKAIRQRVERSASFTCTPEFLPCFGGAGKGCRAPGSSNPKTRHITREDWTHSLIFHHNLLPDGVQLKRRISLSLSCTGQPEADTSEEAPSMHEEPVMALVQACRITRPHARHNQMLKMVGKGCFQYGKSVLRNAVIQLHHQASPPCATQMDEHLEDFELVYAGAWQKLVLPRLSQAEHQQLDALSNQSERDVFVICQNHARNGRGSFFFSTKFVAACTGLSFGRAAQIRKTFLGKKLIEKLPGGYIPGRRALSFRWLLPMI